ncbi:MAG: ABC transporter ATP-binding protein [Bacteroidia bacterium]|nr:ABC transporter ATP-binding protein [Bacteroidia bacterium]
MIQAKSLSYTYPNSSSEVLHALDFEIDKGEIFGFLGPSGAGKSTTQKILYRILSDFGGDVKIEGKDINAWDKTFFEKIGVGFELPNHYQKLSGKENLALFGSFYPKEKLRPAEELFELMGMRESMDDRVETYSKGMKMRLNFMRAIMHDPEILFFDEPTAGLDPVNAHKIKDLIKELRSRGKTIFITTHNMMTADELCDRVSFIVEGKIRITDVPFDLKKAYGKNMVKVGLVGGEKGEFNMKGLGQNPDFLAFIQQGEISYIQSQEASLEEVFIKVTGTSLTP